MSSLDACDHTELRVFSRAVIKRAMQTAPKIDVERLRADMDACVERTSGRKFSLAATGGTNASFYRNFVNDGQNKRMSAEVYLGIVQALGKRPEDYLLGGSLASSTLPSATVLTSTFAVLLDSLGIDPYEDGRAQKLAAQFPSALKSVASLHTDQASEALGTLGATPSPGPEDQPPA